MLVENLIVDLIFLVGNAVFNLPRMCIYNENFHLNINRIFKPLFLL